MQVESGANSNQPRSFEYEYDMKATRQNPALAPVKLTQGELDAMLQAAQQRGFDEGSMQAQAAAQTSREQQQADALSQICAKLDQTASQGLNQLELRASDAAELSFVVARTLAAHALARFPQEQIIGLLEENLEQLRLMPHLILRVHPDLCDPLKERIEQFSQVQNLEYAPMIMPDPQIPWGDARIDWSEGAIKRDYSAALSKMDASIRAFIDAKLGTAQQLGLPLDTREPITQIADDLGLNRALNDPEWLHQQALNETIDSQSSQPFLDADQGPDLSPDLEMEEAVSPSPDITNSEGTDQ